MTAATAASSSSSSSASTRRGFAVLLGSAANDPTNTAVSSTAGKAVAAATANDMKAARSNIDIAVASLEHLDIMLNASDCCDDDNDSGSRRLYDPMELANWTQYLQEGGTVSVTIQMMGQNDANSSTTTTNNANKININSNAIHSSFTLAGLKGASERREADGSRVFTASKPSALKNSSLGAKPLSFASATATAKKSKTAVSIFLMMTLEILIWETKMI